MRNNKKLNSIAAMSKKELQEVNGGGGQYLIYYPKKWIIGIPNDIYDFNQGLFDQGFLEKNTKIMNSGMMR